eukprot:TRINITY_DN183_c1_g1_i1.p1 TRINITY_DN183_c1_g1~~TRINITY_DN183_c1_g1_i1.p1  ORF type:complete len:423 (+),score=140.41 TRINITY_DN183_c1_g1_i1:65-1270(+)
MWLAVAAAAAASAAACTSSLDCSLNGACTAGACACDAAWQGPRCDELAILLRDRSYVPAYGVRPNVTSWGGGILRGADGVFHLFVSEMADGAGNFCGLSRWTSHSRIVHATAADPMGVFVKRDVALPQQAHNAAPVRQRGSAAAPWYLFHIGSASGAPVSNCTPSDAAPPPAPAAAEAVGSFAHVADSPDGPWHPLPSIGCNNPAPAFHPNGTLYCVCNSGGFQVWRTDDPAAGDWAKLGALDFPASWGGKGSPDAEYLRNEDPYLYFDRSGNFHLLVHRYDYRDGYPPNPNQTEPVLVSGHAFSADGVDWRFSDTQPYNNWVDYTDGTRQYFATWERPHLVFNEGGEPTHLVNGVSPVWGDPPCAQCDARPGSAHSCVVCKTSRGVDWDYTLVSALRTAQ